MRTSSVLVLAIAIQGCAAPAVAVRTAVLPAELSVSREQPGELTVSNPTATRAHFRVLAFGWSQDGALEPTSAIAVHPARFELAPGARRRVRVAAMIATGQSYRLVIEERPPLGPPGSDLDRHDRTSIPVLVSP